MTRHAVVTCITLALAAPALAQPAPALSIARIFTNGAPQIGQNTFRVTVNNGSQTAATPAQEPVIVKLIVLDPHQHRSEYEATITGEIGTNGSQTAAFANVHLAKAGPHTVTASAYVPPKVGRADIRAADRSQVFNVGGAQAAAANPLLVLVRQQANGTPVGNVRVSLKADNREIDWKQTGAPGEARFPRVAPSPGGKPYVIEIRSGNNVIGTFDYLMPAQAATFEAKVTQ